jgi:hypothetical protein
MNKSISCSNGKAERILEIIREREIMNEKKTG